MSAIKHLQEAIERAKQERITDSFEPHPDLQGRMTAELEHEAFSRADTSLSSEENQESANPGQA